MCVEFWMGFKPVMDEWRRAAKELLSEDLSHDQKSGSQQVKASADFEKLNSYSETISMVMRLHW